MPEQIEQYMRTLKLGGMAREWRNVEFQSTEQYVRELLELECEGVNGDLSIQASCGYGSHSSMSVSSGTLNTIPLISGNCCRDSWINLDSSSTAS